MESTELHAHYRILTASAVSPEWGQENAGASYRGKARQKQRVQRPIVMRPSNFRDLAFCLCLISSNERTTGAAYLVRVILPWPKRQSMLTTESRPPR